jgi:tetratricopeptide (TPR) repeat protein
VRHFPGAAADEPVHWTDPFYTFNTSCHGCHVSQLSTNYDVKTDTYHTEWAEPGINCETCHGPSQGHIDVCRAAGEGRKPKDLKIISTTPFTAEQTNSMCGSCHAKMNNVSPSFKPGERYFDHFDLITLEHPDFYPDGRDLGENYTMTSWRMSPCVKSSKLDCVHCHTASGRYRFSEAAKSNNACLPCHKELVENIESHTHHPAEDESSKCIACHMPMTKFAHMNRTDHSMRSPTPATTIAFKSPNACNLCHNDKDAAWSDKYVRQWWKKDYQKTVLDWAYLVDAARKGNWRGLDKILQYISRKDRDEVVAASLIRMLRMCDSEKKWPGIVKALKKDSSPLVRSAAAEVLDGYFAGESLKALLAATKDEYRLVRVRAAGSLAGVSAEMLKERHKADVEKATAEFKAAMNARPDDYISHYNFGNFYMARREYSAAESSFQTAIRLRPDYLPSYVNIGFAYNAEGKNDEAEKSFRKALTLDPNSVAAHLNLGMLLGERSRLTEAETTFRKVLELDPNSAVAAYNLGVILAPKRPAEAIKWCEKAYLLQRDNPKYAYTYAFYLNQSNESEVAIAILQSIIKRQTPYPDAYAFLGTIYQSRGQIAKAREVFQAAAKNTKLPQQARREFDIMVRRLR